MAIKGRAVLQALWPKSPPFVCIGTDTHTHAQTPPHTHPCDAYWGCDTHLYGHKRNKSTAPWTRSNQLAIMAGLIIMCCFCLLKWRVSVSAILSWIRPWKTVACSFKCWIEVATSGPTVKQNDGLFRNQCPCFICKVNNLHISFYHCGSTRHDRKFRGMWSGHKKTFHSISSTCIL